MLRTWLQTVNYEPGISRESFQTVEDFSKNALVNGKKLYFNLCLDEMSIRRHVSWNKSKEKFEGFVDFGRPTDCQDNEEQASNALVFMLVCINGYFKIPVAYYLINSLSGDQKSSLILEILDECCVHEIDVRNITFDGALSNINMVEKLGASIYGNTSISYFHSSILERRIYVSLDACHMLKLVRNALLSRDIIDGEGKIISWDYIRKLVDLQDKEGLHLATKIKRRHVEPFNEKMKVCLAAQVLSRSVAAALETCEFDLELDQFENASATARFCRIIDDCFDLLNSRNQFNKCPSKSSISTQNIKEMKMKVQIYTRYFENLQIDGRSILKTKKRTGFLGLIISMKNALQMAEEMFAEGHLDFLLTYKLSQDHLEMFFACIRKTGGFNNNPTAMQFKSAYRKLISHVSIKVPLTANCTPKDDTIILMNKTDKDDQNCDVVNENEESSKDFADASILCDMLPLSMYIDEVIAYVSGAVVKSIKNKIKCSACIDDLTANAKEHPLSSLQVRKTYGALTSASQDVIFICQTAEKILKAQNSLVQPRIVDKMIITAIKMLPVNALFTKNEHVFDQAPLFDHRNQLIRMVLKQYYLIRLHHEAAKISEFKSRVRTKLQRIIVFSNQ
uniref:THAP-type domain-containing protein n=1 Tax=Trichogramma kaykai TaxID=54128 RepID=A0ABD2WYE5_9HYME